MYPLRAIVTIIFFLTCMFATTAQADHVFFRMGIAEVTVGYDVQKDESTIRKWYIGAVGPGDLQGEALAFCRFCAEEALYKSAQIGYSTPGEVSIKIAAAINSWNILFPSCMSGKAFGKALVSKFKLGLVEEQLTKEGLVIRAKTYETQAKMYAELYDRMGKIVGGDIGKAPTGYAELERKIDAATRIDIDIQMPREITSGMTRMTALNPQEAGRQMAELAARIQQEKLDVKIAQIAPQIMNVPKQVVQQIETALHAFAGGIESLLPNLPDGKVIEALPAQLGQVGQQIVNAGKDIVSQAPIPQPSDPQKCRDGDRGACCRIGLAAFCLPEFPKFPNIPTDLPKF